jgi:hypothetical protein
MQGCGSVPLKSGRINADPNPALHFNADPDPTPAPHWHHHMQDDRTRQFSTMPGQYHMQRLSVSLTSTKVHLVIIDHKLARTTVGDPHWLRIRIHNVRSRRIRIQFGFRDLMIAEK